MYLQSTLYYISRDAMIYNTICYVHWQYELIFFFAMTEVHLTSVYIVHIANRGLLAVGRLLLLFPRELHNRVNNN